MWTYGVPTFHHTLIFPAADCLRLHEFAASFHDHHLHHLWDQTGRGDTISGLHERRHRGGFTPETVTWCYFHPNTQRERKRDYDRQENERKPVTAKEAERTWKLKSVLQFFFLFFFVRFSFIAIEGCVLVLSVSRNTVSVYLFISTTFDYFCAGLVLHLQDERGARGSRFHVREHQGRHKWYVL